jgi:hypothetical protein
MTSPSVQYKVSTQKTLNSTSQEVWGVSSNRWLRCAVIHISNGGAVAAIVTVCLLPNATTVPAQGNALIWEFSLAANDFLEFGEGILMSPGYFLVALAAPDDVVLLQFSGIEEYGIAA